MTTRAKCPGRICLGGEDLDWMGGSTLQAAIGLGITATAELERTDGDGEVALSSAWPVGIERTVWIADAAKPRGDALDFPSTALACASAEFGGFAGRIALTSTLPMAAGLASSAACLVATIAAIAGELELGLTRERICGLAFRTETEWLQTGAGEMDFWACGLGGTRLTRFDSEKQISVVAFPRLRAEIVVGDSRAPAATAGSIAIKRERFRLREPAIVEYQRRTDMVVSEMGNALAMNARVTDIGRYVTACHEAIAVLMASSTRQIDEMVASALCAGAAGAKLTGGGEGGCMFAIVGDDTPPDNIAIPLETLGARAYATEISTDGVVVVTER